MTPAKQWTDPQGRIVPEHLVSDADRMKDDLTERLLAGAESVQGVLAAYKKTVMDEMRAAKELLFEQYGVTIGKGSKGGFRIRSYDGSCMVEIAVQDRIVFGPELEAAKALIDRCIERWGDGANENLRLLVNDAFQVNKAGRIDTKRVLGLRKFKMKNPDGSPDLDWDRAMDAITDAMIVDQTATYPRIYARNETTGAMELVNLDFSKL
ncbi:DUF3164 family protein [Paracoccus sp. (in: a-proteobacteria)]|uniref:DUF3164 family protein n=1 Tax=Paracoccus sp. TaxID=267 RepID=UPI0028B237DE|nr:DUF3164 family protein [Paracoccus sp. (in: a-proteobacteria)]